MHQCIGSLRCCDEEYPNRYTKVQVACPRRCDQALGSRDLASSRSRPGISELETRRARGSPTAVAMCESYGQGAYGHEAIQTTYADRTTADT